MLGEEHPDTLASFDTLATLAAAMGDDVTAGKLKAEVYEIFRMFLDKL